MTLGWTVAAAVCGAALGVGCAWARLHGGRVRRAVAVGYMKLGRHTPILVPLFFLCVGLPWPGLQLSSPVAALLAMVVCLGACVAEMVCSGLERTPRGQIEAARSLAMTDLQIFTRIVLPPVLGRAWLGMVRRTMVVMVGAAVCSQITHQIDRRHVHAAEAVTLAATVCLLLAIGSRRVFGRVLQRTSRRVH